MRLIDADALLNNQANISSNEFGDDIVYVEDINNAPTVEAYTFEQVQDLVLLNKKLSEETPQWIPVTYRQMDNDEYCNFCKEYGEIPVEERKVFNCKMPEDGQEILISTKYGHIFLDTCVYDDGYGLEEYGDWEDVIAWMPLPTPYMKEGELDAKNPGNR